MPDLLGDVRDYRVSEPQEMFQHLDQRVTCASFLIIRGLLAIENGLGKFQIPVAVFVPGEVIDSLCHVVKAISFDSIRYGFDGFLEP